MKINTIQVFGERNSGTNFLNKSLLNNTIGIKNTNGYGWKHGPFGEPSKYVTESGELKTRMVFEDQKKNLDSTLILVIFRDPFTWIQSMQRSPHHAPKHWFLNMHDFLSTPWQSYYSKPGQPSSQDREFAMECVKPANLFEDEKSIMHLRSKKIKMQLEFINKAPNVYFVNYERLAANPNSVIAEVCRIYGIKTKKDFKNVTEDKFGDKVFKKKEYKPIESRDLKLIINSLDWSVESKAGYSLDKEKFKLLNSGQKSLINKLLRKKNYITNPSDYLVYDYIKLAKKNGRKVKL